MTVSKQTGGSGPSVQRSLRRGAITAVVLLLGLVSVTPPGCFRATQTIGEDFSILDDSWGLDLAVRWSRREYAGRDFVFTRGPIDQFLRSSVMWVPPGDLATLVRLRGLPEVWIAALCAWALLWLTGAPLSWRAVVFLLWTCLLPPATVPAAGIRPMAGLLLVTACGHLLGTAIQVPARGRDLRAASLWAVSSPVLLLFAFDLGVLTMSALLLTALLTLVWTMRLPSPIGPTVRGRVLRCGLAAVLGFLLFAVGITVMSGWRFYLRDSWEMASGYSVMMAWPCSGSVLWMIGLALSASVIAALMAGHQLRSCWRAASGGSGPLWGLLAAACFCTVWTRYGLTRSDPIHMATAVAPTAFVLGGLLPCYLRAGGLRFRWAALLVCVPLLLLPLVEMQSWKDRLAGYGNADFRRAELEVRHEQIREGVAITQGMPDDALYVWPYECVVNHLAGKSNPAYTVQSYSAHTNYLERATIERLESVPDLPVLVFTSSWPIDDVENLTRTPRIFRYLLDNYVLAAPRQRHVLLLRRHAPQNRCWCAQALPGVTGRFQPGERKSLHINLPDEGGSGCSASDLFILRLRAAQTLSLGLGKPGKSFATLWLSNGERRVIRVLLPQDGKTHEVLVSACTVRDPLFLSLFHAKHRWRARERVVALELSWSSMDIFSPQPSEIILEGVDVLRCRGIEVVETKLADQDQPGLWNWCYADGLATKNTK